MRAVSFALLLVSCLACAQSAPAATLPGPEHWEIPSSDEIRRVLAQRVTIRGAGLVVGVIEPSGRRVVACGEGHTPDGSPLDGHTIFQIGSVTKTFTTLLLADSIHRGEVALDDPVAKYLPRDLPLHERGRPMTLRDLATHVSGLPSMPSNFNLRGRPDPISAYSSSDLERFLATFRPARAPGDKWEYSNLGVSLLGRLLAQRTAKSYEALLRERLIEPLGLRDTAISLSREQRARVAPGLDRYGEPAIAWEMKTLQASGSLRSSANDLLEYLAVILGYRKSTLRAAIDLQLATRSPARKTQALGWGLATFGGRDIFVHDGGKAGYRSLVAFDPSRGRGVVLLVNARTDERLGALALWLINGNPLPQAPIALASRPRVIVDRRTLASYEGRYRFDDGRELAVVRKRGGLIVGTEADGASAFIAASDREFYDPSDVVELEFRQAGRADAVTLYEQGRERGQGIAGRRISTLP